MNYKAGDRVKIKSLDWYNENKDKTGRIRFKYENFIPEMSQYCGEILTIKQVEEESECCLVSECGFAWTDEMIEGLAEAPLYKATVDKNGNMTGEFVRLKEVKQEINLPDGYIFKDENGNVINATKIVLEKKKREYPTNYEECCKVLGIEGDSLLINTTHITDYERDLGNLMGRLHRLIICRDAYWKIAGDEMGLGKPWEPENPTKHYIFTIETCGDDIIKNAITSKWINRIFVFPTEEMRDAFKGNFDKDLEFCKELL